MADQDIADEAMRHQRAEREAAKAKYQREYYLKNREKKRAYKKAHYAAHSEEKKAKQRAWTAAHLDEVRATNRAYHMKNREARNAARMQRYYAAADQRSTPEAKQKARDASRRSMQKRREEQPERVKREAKAWRDANKGKIRIWSALHHARRKGAPGHYTSADVEEIRKGQRDRCAYCGVALRGKGHLDHVVAIVNGGSNNRSNLQLTCRRCNTRKKALDPIVFARKLGKLL